MHECRQHEAGEAAGHPHVATTVVEGGGFWRENLHFQLMTLLTFGFDFGTFGFVNY